MSRLFVFILFSYGFISQAAAQKQFNAGITAGFTATQVDGDNWQGYYKVGLCGGGFVNTMIGERYSLQLELLYTQKGSKHNPDPVNSPFSFYEMGLSYIEIPILFRYHIKPQLIAEGGISYGRLLSSQEEDMYGILPDDQAPFQKSEYAVHGGMDLKVYKNLHANLRASYSILAIRFKPQISGYYIIGGQFNNVISFSLRYFFTENNSSLWRKSMPE